MRIEDYFSQIRMMIDHCPIVQLSTVTYEKRGTNEGLVRGELLFVDGSNLHLREYIDVELIIDRLMYVYQYMKEDTTLIFRYDNTGHHRTLGLVTYPHHKHQGQEIILPSSAPSLETVLEEIQSQITLP